MSDEKPKTGDSSGWENCTPEQCIINTMEDVENINDLMFIYTGKDGMIYWKSNFTSMAVKIGLLEFVKEMIVRSAAAHAE